MKPSTPSRDRRPAPGAAAAGLLIVLAACSRSPEDPATSAATPATGAVPAAAPAASAPAAAPAAEPERCPGNLPGDLLPAIRAKVRRPDGGTLRDEAFDSSAVAKVTLYVFNSTGCGYCAHYAPRFADLEKRYMSRGVDVVYVYPNRAEPADEKASFHREKGYAGGLIDDADASIAQSLAVEKTPTVFLVDAKQVIAYRGAVDDAPIAGDAVKERWLERALDAVLAGKPVEVQSTEPAG